MSTMYGSPAPVRAGLSLPEAEALVAAMVRATGVPAPTLRWSDKTRRGHYYALGARLVVGPRCWRGANVVVHEFAHHLDIVRNGTKGRGGRWHGDTFSEALRECAEVVWPCATMYSWATEYATVRRWWRQHGPARLEDIFDKAMLSFRREIGTVPRRVRR